MKVNELRSACDALARFATVREKNEAVDTRIGVQAGGGRLKLISSDGRSGMVVDLCPSDDSATFYIDARPLFQGAKVLPAKSDITLDVSNKGLSIKTDTGGSLQLPNKGTLYDAGFAKKPKSIGGTTSIYGLALNQMSKLFTATTRGEEKLSIITGDIQVTGDAIHFTFVEPRVKTKYASWHKDLAFVSGQPTLNTLDGGFFESLKSVSGDATVVLNVQGVMVEEEHQTIYTSNVLGEGPLPILSVKGDLISFTMERKKLIDLLKGQIPHDEHGRVVMTWGRDELEVRPYGNEDGMTIPVKTIGTGSRGVNANLMLDMLGGMDDAKVVSVRIAQGSPAIILSAEEYKDWTLLVAPLVQ